MSKSKSRNNKVETSEIYKEGSRFLGAGMPKMTDDQLKETQRFLGAGASPNVQACCAATLDAIQCDAARIPKHAEQRSHFIGPVSDGALVELLTPQLKLLNQGQEVVAADDVVETNIDSGSLQQNMLIVGVYVELVPNAYVQTIEGGAWTAPTGAGNTPVVPDVWTKADATAANSLGLTGSQTLTKAFLDVGGWIQDFGYHFAEAYNLWWNPGGSTILDMPLRRVMTIKGAERGTSPSRRPFAQAVADANAYYRAPVTGVATSSIFLPRNATRTGNLSLGGTEMGTFSPYDYGDEEVSYDPGVLSPMCSNPCYYELPYAVAFPRALNTSLYFRQVDTVATARAARALSYTNNLLNSNTNGATPPGIIAPDQFVTTANFSGSGASPVFVDLSKDSNPTNVPMQTPIGTTYFKIGDFFLAVGFVGWPIGDTMYRQMVDGQTDICSYLMNATQGRCGFRAVSG